MPSGSGIYPDQIGAMLRTYKNRSGVVSQEPLQPVVIKTGSWARSSVRTPDYHELRTPSRRHELPMNPFEFNCNRFFGVNGYDENFTIYSDGTTSSMLDVGLFENNVPTPSMSLDVMNDLTSLAASRLRSGIKNQTINVGVAVGEGKQTLDLIANKAKQIAGGARALRRGDIGGAAKALGVSSRSNYSRGSHKASSVRNAVAQHWLELQYGWKPLLSDIYGAAEFLANHIEQITPRTRFSASATRDVNIDYPIEHQSLVAKRTLHIQKYTVRYIVYFSEQQFGGIPPVALGLINPLSIAWELVPFSFVADWVFPLGSFLNGLDSTLSQVFVKGCRTEFWKGSTLHSETGEAVLQGGTIYSRRGSREWLAWAVHCKRVPLTGFPSQPLPTFKSPLSVVHAANALALLAQVFR